MSVFYVTNYKKIDCDVSISPNQNYELTLQQIGEIDWPFGSVNGRLILSGEEQGDEKILLYFDGQIER